MTKTLTPVHKVHYVHTALIATKTRPQMAIKAISGRFLDLNTVPK